MSQHQFWTNLHKSGGVQVDLLDLGAGRDPRFRYVLVYIELYSRRVWLRALSTKEAMLVAAEVGCAAVN